MTCAHCGQDVPVVPRSDDPELVTCVACQTTYAWNARPQRQVRVDAAHDSSLLGAGSMRASNESLAGRADATPPLVATDDDWDEMYDPYPNWTRVDRAPTTSADGIAFGTLSDSRVTREHEVDAEQSLEPSQAIAASRRRRRSRGHWFQWLVLMLGVSMFTAGAALIAWSFHEDQQALWDVGAPLALAGQVAFLIGLVLQLDIIWQQSKMTARVVNHLEDRLPADCRDDQGTGRNDTAQCEATPDRILSDLKGQLDHLATRLSGQPKI